ncbi:response regulator [Paenibacillus sp. MCAF20]
MKVILVDDEPAMHLILRKMLAKLPGIEVAGAFTDTKSAASFIRDSGNIELAFVDISIPGESGMEFAVSMEAANAELQIVFVTSHKDYALRAYELAVVDYLVKPVSQERLGRTVNRILANRRQASPSREVEPGTEQSDKTRVTVLGDVSVSNERGRVKWISRKCAELFAYLLIHHGRRIPRSRLVEDIFGGMVVSNAESYLNTTVYQLRKSLETIGLRDVVRSENDGYALELKDSIIDYIEFARRVEEIRPNEVRDMERALQVERLYAGRLFGDKAYIWAIYETERYEDLYASFVKQLAELLISIGDSSVAWKLLLKLNERNPLDDSVIRMLMTIREMTGDKKGLTVLYTDFARLLSRELGIRPSNEMIHHYDLLISRFDDSNKRSTTLERK